MESNGSEALRFLLRVSLLRDSVASIAVAGTAVGPCNLERVSLDPLYCMLLSPHLAYS